jgi:membrane protease YdiL (CAAX protease family)
MTTTSAFAKRSALRGNRRRPFARSRRTPELAATILLLGASNVAVNRVLSPRAYPYVNGSTALALLWLAHAAGVEPSALGLDVRHAGRSAVVGLAGASAVVLAFGVALGVPSLRTAFDDQRIEDQDLGSMLWNALVRIPVGTVLLEEVAFRGVLPALLGGGDHWHWKPVLGASALFGLWHVLPSLELHRNAAVSAMFGAKAATFLVPAAAVLASAAAGVTLSAYRHAGRGLLAPALVHTATNSGGALAAWWVLRHAPRSRSLQR